MRKMFLGFVIGLVLGLPFAAQSVTSGAPPREVSLTVPCQTSNQLNCSWYGVGYAPTYADSPPPAASTLWYNYATPDGQFCRYRLSPIRQLTCASHWPLTQQDEFPGSKK